jgi:hypothetical protein
MRRGTLVDPSSKLRVYAQCVILEDNEGEKKKTWYGSRKAIEILAG